MTKLILSTLLFMLSSAYGQTCISHRANSANAPENSLEAIERNVQSSFDGIEIDIQLSKDGVAFVYHDKILGKGLEGETCPLKEKITKTNFQDIHRNCFLANGEKLATLEEALFALKDFQGHIFLDLKQKPNLAFYELLETHSFQKRQKLRFISFKKRALRPLKRRWPKAKATLLSRFIPRGLFYQGIGFNKRLNIFTGLYRWLGKNVSIWTLNEKKEMQKAIDKKADFIITDNYQLCVDTTAK